MGSFGSGFLVGFGLIFAIGAQNAFILKQGLRKQYVLAVVLTCAISDTLLIVAGVMGFAEVIQVFPMVEKIARYGGAAFLLIYGARCFWAALMKQQSLDAEGGAQKTAWSAVLTCLALTWLNPHVYLDTMVLIGSISTQYSESLFAFGMGAVTSSWVFFLSLGYGSRLLIPLFSSSLSWKVLDVLIGVIMWSIAVVLVI